ncbi:D-Ala-D-Ala carboxypeptidase family metallohydrolase [Pontixanthobacter aestiaquae]|uniref:D-Ala-D-Ala carboxypeptidase family metallohydrolase n=1 Tax=Pontixanthobacter aestiaquae TaxID=1509367 RepID=UPI0025B46532|nr:D-Ala-D-Ala carboxypeptidase family metallohydrolase [Pontixanthobacter aestiaquae]MDN3645783.1 D-Ala-D-Ala carboxypeptidase family metallohydrolase [Pontixanthobacter aestiaquae]
MTKLTENFTLAEMVRSQQALRRGIPNSPGSREVTALRILCENVLQPVREHFGKPVNISSGFRSPRLNRAIGGSGSSQHCLGEAADFIVSGVSNLEVCKWMERRLNYDQLIYEFGEPGWVHCSFSTNRMRNMELSAMRLGGRVKYLSGLRA